MAHLKSLDQLIQKAQQAKSGQLSLAGPVPSGKSPINNNRELIHQAMQAEDPISAIANLFQSNPAAAWAFLQGERIGDIDLPSERKR